MADKKKAKAAAAKKGKKGKKGASGDSTVLTLANHPRAGASVKRMKAMGGLLGFAIGAYVSYSAGVPVVDVLLRGLLSGIAGRLVFWAASVAVWRQLVLAELRAAEQRFLAARADNRG